MTVRVLYGTETGTAEMAADDLAEAIGAPAPDDLSDVAPDALSTEAAHLIVSSSYGDGELPASARPFAEALSAGARLHGVRFAMLGLGDRSCETFAGGAETLRATLLSAGASEAAAFVRRDASGSELSEDAGVERARSAAARSAAA